MFSSTVKISLRKSEDLSDGLLNMLKSISYHELFAEIINRTLCGDDVLQLATSNDLIIQISQDLFFKVEGYLSIDPPLSFGPTKASL
jgi:hypothetical protein